MKRLKSTPTSPLKRDLQFLAMVTPAILVIFSLLRAMLWWRNRSLGADVPSGDLLTAFVLGIRFDLAVTAYIVIPLILALFSPHSLGRRRLARIWLGATTATVIFLGVVELDFYREFHNRLNSLVFQYLREDPSTVTKMLWAGFPVVRYVLVVAVLWLALQWIIKFANAVTRSQPAAEEGNAGYGWSRAFITRTVTAFALLVLGIGAARGSFSPGPPLRWGDAIHSGHTFANHLALNGTFTFVKAALASDHAQLSRWWLDSIGRDEALARTRTLLVSAGDTLQVPQKVPVQRYHRPANHYRAGEIKNVVLIIMESFAGAYIGALGDNQGITPQFDQLARQGLLFTRFFSNGTHTHQGMFASVACFPNLPGHEYLMQQPEGLHRFSGLPVLFDTESDNDAYLYNGDFRWDNQEGFFRNQGMDKFIGRDQIERPSHIDAVWGVSDQDVFRQAEKELDDMSDNGPFYAVIQTLSNHTPFSLPDPLPVAKVAPGVENSKHLTAMRYSDWALGQFFAAVKDKPYFGETLFIVVGDHGFGNSSIVSEVDLNRFRVPLLLIAPHIRERFGAVSDMVGSQVDIVPTAMALLGKPFSHQCWGRDLLSLDSDAPGFAVIKPSGSEQTAAIIRGDRILTLSSQTRPVPGVLTFDGKLSWEAAPSGTAAVDALEKDLKSYINTALTALYDNRTGVVDLPGSEVEVSVANE